MPKGAPRTATAAAAILRQQATEPHSEPTGPKQIEVTDQRGPADDGTPVAYKPATKGVKAGLKQGETRITCVFREDQSQVLHDWAKTTGRTFREICLAMAERYIDEVVRKAAGEGLTLNHGGKEPPEAYTDLYGDTPDQWAKFFE